MMIGLPAIVYGSGVKWRTLLRLPSWKIQTRAPKLALIESRVMITALSGIASDPNRRNRTIALAIRVRPIANGIRSPWATRKSWPIADSPPTIVLIPLPALMARMAGTIEVAWGDAGSSLLIA